MLFTTHHYSLGTADRIAARKTVTQHQILGCFLFFERGRERERKEEEGEELTLNELYFLTTLTSGKKQSKTEELGDSLFCFLCRLQVSGRSGNLLNFCRLSRVLTSGTDYYQHDAISLIRMLLPLESPAAGVKINTAGHH